MHLSPVYDFFFFYQLALYEDDSAHSRLFPYILILISSSTIEEQTKLFNKTGLLSKICSMSQTLKRSMQKPSEEVSWPVLSRRPHILLGYSSLILWKYFMFLWVTLTISTDLKKGSIFFRFKNQNNQSFLCIDMSCESQIGSNPTWISDTITSIFSPR